MGNPIPPDSTAIAYKCKICDKDGITYASNLCDPLAVKQLVPMLTCDPCHGYFTQHREAIERIGKAASMWVQQTTGQGVPKPETRANIATVLEATTKRLAAIIAEKFGSPVYHWDRDIVNLILEKPRLVYTIIGNMERTLRDLHTKPQQT